MFFDDVDELARRLDKIEQDYIDNVDEMSDEEFYDAFTECALLEWEWAGLTS